MFFGRYLVFGSLDPFGKGAGLYPWSCIDRFRGVLLTSSSGPCNSYVGLKWGTLLWDTASGLRPRSP